MAFMLRV